MCFYNTIHTYCENTLEPGHLKYQKQQLQHVSGPDSNINAPVKALKLKLESYTLISF